MRPVLTYPAMSTTNGTTADVIVIGAGNAALCAALAAREAGKSVIALEKAPEGMRGGNTYFTGGAIRFAYKGIEDVVQLVPDLSQAELDVMEVGSYTEAKYFEDLMRVTEGLSDQEMADTLVRQSFPTMRWMYEQGVRFVPSWTHQAFKVDGKFRFWGGLCLQAVGGGKGLSDQLFEIAIERGVDVRYDHTAMRLEQDEAGRVCGVVVRTPDGRQTLSSGAVVLACGGFEANPEMRARYLGPGWELAKVRGVRYNTGDGHRMAFDVGAQAFGHYSGCHAVAWDLNAPPFGNRSITDLYQKHSYPFGLIVNVDGKRFVDEGADFRNYTYAKYGKQILFQPERAAFQLFDQKTLHLLRDEYRIPQVTKGEADTIEGTGGSVGHRPCRTGADRRRVQRRLSARRLQPDGAGRRAYGERRAAQDELGAAAGHAAVRGLRRYVRHYVHVRRAAHRSSSAGDGHDRQPHPRPLRRGRDRRRPLLSQLRRRRGTDAGLRLRQGRRSIRRGGRGVGGSAISLFRVEVRSLPPRQRRLGWGVEA